VSGVGDRLREDDRRDLAAMSPEARVRLALALGTRDLDTFRLSHDPPLDPDEASRRLRLQRQAGRRPSRSMTSSLG
jgi:hypothetical protein